MPIYFGGSRNLPPLSFAPFFGVIVRRVLRSGQAVHVGCSAGADQLVISCIRSSSFPQVRVFSAFSPSGAGSCSVSAVSAVQAFAQAGGSVSWLAGGSLAVPLAGRLIQRSIAGLRGCSAAVFFSPGAGSLAVATHAVAASIPVFAFTLGYHAAEPPAQIPACAGQWVVSSFAGFACWQWSPAQLSFF